MEKKKFSETDLYAPICDFLKKEGFVVKSEVKGCDATARCVFPKYDKNSRRNRNFYGQRGSKQKKRSFVKQIYMLLFVIF